MDNAIPLGKVHRSEIENAMRNDADATSKEVLNNECNVNQLMI